MAVIERSAPAQETRPAGSSAPGARTRKVLEKIGANAILIALSIVFLMPFAWMLSGSIKTAVDLNAFPVVWFPETITFENYIAGVQVFPFARYLFNTLVICVFSMIGAVLSSSFVAYGLSRIEWRWR